jgi:hypothetical protein
VTRSLQDLQRSGAQSATRQNLSSRHPIQRGARQRPLYTPAYQREIKVLNGEELLTTQFPPRNMMLSPWLPDKGLAMVYAERGIGKTWIALSIAHAVASGGEFLCWRAPRPRKCPPRLFRNVTRRLSRPR